MKRLFDILASAILAMILIIPMIIIFILVKLGSRGPAVHWSKRIGRDNQIFLMPKFRSMFVETPQVATHLLTDSQNFVTPIGKILRKTSLDELPQLFSVLKGDMSLVGPRPALFNQDDLKELRTACGVEKLRPGVTGWAQINGRDDLPIPIKVNFDKEYLDKQSLLFDIRILILTLLQVVTSKGIKH